jgi:hemerythrin-like domain-containing protein
LLCAARSSEILARKKREGDLSHRATTILRREHEAILKMLDATEATAHKIEKGGMVPPETLVGLLEFLRLFADRCHHGKEEDLLFPKLGEKGFSPNAGPVAVMLYEHEQGRALIRKMVKASEACTAGNSEEAREWAAAAHDYVSLLRAHIDKENTVLFTMAEHMLSEQEQEELAEAFEKAELEKMGEGTHERLHALMEKLLAEIFPPTVALA